MDKLKSDMLELIEISGQMGMYNEMLLKHNEITNKKNYNPKKM